MARQIVMGATGDTRIELKEIEVGWPTAGACPFHHDWRATLEPLRRAKKEPAGESRMNAPPNALLATVNTQK